MKLYRNIVLKDGAVAEDQAVPQPWDAEREVQALAKKETGQ
jgi:hypothetical protein